MTTIYLVRHAEAEGNLYRIAHGHYNSCITDDRGCRQIRALAERFRDVPVDAVYASDLIRTRTTAQSIYLPKGLQLHPDPAFREICMGEWEEHCWYELLRKYPQSHHDFNHRLDRWQVPGSETAQQVLDRYLPALRRVARQPDGGHFLPRSRHADRTGNFAGPEPAGDRGHALRRQHLRGPAGGGGR